MDGYGYLARGRWNQRAQRACRSNAKAEPQYEDYYRSAAPRAWQEPEPQKESRRTIEEIYARGRPARSPTHSPRSDKDSFEDEGYDSGEDYRIKYRRKVRERRARSVSADRAPPVRARSASTKGREMIRYPSRRRNVDDTDSDEERTIYPSDVNDDGDDRRSARSGSSGKSKALAQADEHGPHCATGFVFPPAFRHPADDEDYDSEEDERERRKRRNKRLLYTGLATVSTIATCNGVYQNHKGYRLRRAALEQQATPCAAEVKRLKRKALAQDALAVAIVGVGVNNLRLAWQKTKTLKEQDQEARRRWEEHRMRRELGRDADGRAAY